MVLRRSNISPQWLKRYLFSKSFDTKYSQNVTLTVQQTLFWAFDIWNGEKCSISDTRTSLGATNMTFWPDIVSIVLENWCLLKLCGLIFDLFRLIKRSQYYCWYQISKNFHHFMFERLKHICGTIKVTFLYLFASEMVFFWVSVEQYLIL